MPITANTPQDIINIVNQLFDIRAEGYTPSPELEAAISAHRDSPSIMDDLLQQLIINLKEAIDEASETQLSMQPWKSLVQPSALNSFVQVVTRALQVSRSEYIGLNAEESSQLYILIQLSSYARFLQNQENDTAYKEKRTQITDLQFKIVQTGRFLRKLLPLSDEDIKNYLVHGIADRKLALETVVPTAKRAACCIAIELMLNTLQKIRVSVDTSSVVMM